MLAFRTIIWGMVFMFLALVAGPWVATQFDASFPPLCMGPMRFIGVVPLLAGLALAAETAWVLVRPGEKRATPYDAGGFFTIGGPYHYVRNPFMLGMVLALWGEAVIMARIPLYAYALIITWCIHFWVIFFEEPSLTERFGSEYESYRRTVPRWLPRLTRYDHRPLDGPPAK